MKKILIILVIIACLAVGAYALLPRFNSDCAHAYDNSCDIDCNECGEKREASHSFADADCLAPKTCTVCGATEGEALGHSFEPVSNLCTDGSICKNCSAPGEAVSDHIDEDGDFICDRNGCEYCYASPIYTVDDLKAAFENGGKFILMNDIDVGEEEIGTSVDNPVFVDINLNGKTIQVAYWRGLSVYAYSTLRLSNGKVVNNNVGCRTIVAEGNLFLKNVTVESDDFWPVSVSGTAKAVIEDCKLVGCLYVDVNATAFVSNTQLVRDENYAFGSGIDIYDAGYAVFDFNPSEYIQDYFNGTFTANDNGTWSIAGCYFDGNAPTEPSIPDPEKCIENGHSFIDASCLMPKICLNCFATEGEIGDHTIKYIEAICTNGSYCVLCFEAFFEHNQHIDDNNDYLCDRIGCSYSAIKSISTAEELREAFTYGGKYKLTSDIDLGDATLVEVYIFDNVYIDLDLNSFTITTSYWAGMIFDPNMIVRLSNGTIIGTAPVSGAICCYGTLFLENCTAIGNGYWSVYIQDGAAVINNCTLIEGIGIGRSDVFITNSDIQTSPGRGCDMFENGYLLCDFDVTDYTGYVVNNTNNNDGTWTVTSTDFSGEIPTKPTFTEIPFIIIPPVPEITGIEISGDGVTLNGTTYTVVIPEGESSLPIKVYVIGKNFNLMNEENKFNCNFSFNGGLGAFDIYEYVRYTDNLMYGDTAYIHNILIESNPNKILYTNDGGLTWIDTGYTLIVVEGE